MIEPPKVVGRTVTTILNEQAREIETLKEVNQRLRNALTQLNHRVHTNYNFNADPDAITALVGDALK